MPSLHSPEKSTMSEECDWPATQSTTVPMPTVEKKINIAARVKVKKLGYIVVSLPAKLSADDVFMSGLNVVSRRESKTDYFKPPGTDVIRPV